MPNQIMTKQKNPDAHATSFFASGQALTVKDAIRYVQVLTWSKQCTGILNQTCIHMSYNLGKTYNSFNIPLASIGTKVKDVPFILDQLYYACINFN